MTDNHVITPEYLRGLLKLRPRGSHKGDYGRLLIVAGSPGMAGAAVLCARGAYRSGAGLVKISIDETLFPVLHGGAAEATCMGRDFPEGCPEGFDAAAAGPGLGDTRETAALVRMILRTYKGTLVLDADALNAIAGDRGLQAELRLLAGRTVVTPHAGEAARLLGADIGADGGARIAAAVKLAEITGAVAVLKGADSLVVSPDGEMMVNRTGNPGMATGGSGDVLTGIIASLAGQGLRPFDAAAAGVHIHGRAGDLAAEKYGEYGMTAADVAEMTAFAIKEIVGK
ncbi:MAG: NAD(P)H-hydrate dehydratase [Clostridiales Family XIII bacterium]|jgi:NAD(P)H-hydrate epimerase|nr:NAD(P)H-hydrate dehydratase [Clostridiales Family XIII bacterium]